MATPFNLVAQLQLSGPTNLGPVVRRVQAALNNISANVNITLGRGAISNLTKANVQLKDMSAHLSAIAMNASKAEASIRSMVASLNSVKTGGAATGTINVNMKNASHAIKQATNEMEEFGRVSALAVRRFLAFSIPAGLLVSTVTGIKGAVSAAVDYNREFVRLQQITSASAASIKNISNEVTRLATSMGTSSAELIKVSNTLAAAGLTAKQTKIALESLAQTQLSSQFEDIENTVDGAIAAMQQFKIPVEDLNKTLASVTAVSREFAAESRDIVVAIQHAGGAFKSAGGNIEELMALFTAIRSTTRESAESIATGLRTIMTRIERPRTIEYMRQLGIELQDIKGKFVGPYEAIRRMGEALRGLDSRDVRYAQIVEELGGYRQVSKVIPALQETAAMQRALMVAQSGSNALAQEAAIAQEALSVKLTKVKEAWLALGRDVVESKGFKIMAESAMAFATALTQVLRALQPIIPMLTTLAAIKGIQAVASFAPGFAKGLKFARGGVVPGTGDRDTVPAMLQPGEFVLRKSAVKAIGTDALHNANRFAGGGVVRSGRMLYGDNPTQAEIDAAQKTWDRNMKKAVNFEYQAAMGTAVRQGIKFQDWKAKYPITKGKSSNVPSDDIQSLMLKARVLRYGTPDGSSYGGLFLYPAGKKNELVVGSQSSTQYNKSQSQNDRNIDLITGPMTASYAKKGSPELKIWMEKRIFSTIKELSKRLAPEGQTGDLGKINKSIRTELLAQANTQSIAGSMFEGAIAAYTGAISGKSNTLFDFKGLSEREGSLLSELFGNQQRPPLLDAKISDSSTHLSSIIDKAKKSGIQGTVVGFNELIDREKELLKKSLEARKSMRRSASNTTRSKKASGGGISGTDSVPALLTPGEFVFNKDAVNRIGVGNLHKMNKYASGGVVKMATGGTPPANAGSFAGTSMFGIMGISTLAQSFFGLESSIGKTIQKFTEFAITIEGARMAMGMLQGMAHTAKGGIGGMFSNGLGGFDSRGIRTGFADLRMAFRGEKIPGSGSSMGALPLNMFTSSKHDIIGPRGVTTRVLPSRLSYLNRGLERSGLGMGITAGSALVAGGLLYGASMQDKEAERLVQLSGGDFSKIGGAESAAKSSNMMSAAGMGVGAGAAIGSVFGPLGTLAGAAVVGGIGALIGALRDNTSEVRSNTASLATQKATEGFSDAFSRISSGTSFNVAGDTQKAMSELGRLFNVIKNAETIPDKALRDKNIDEAYRSIKGQGVAFNEFLKPMLQGIKNVSELDSNKNAQLLISGMAVAGGVGTNEVKERVQKDIDALNSHSEMIGKNTDALLKVENTLNVLDKFAIYTSMSGQKTARQYERIGITAGSGTGQYNTFLPYQSGFMNEDIARNIFIDQSEIDNRLNEMFRGSGESASMMQADASDMFNIMRDLPEIVRKAADESIIGKDGDTTDIQTNISRQLEENYGSNPIIDIIKNNLGKVISSNRQGGDVEVRQGIISDAQNIAQELTGERGKKHIALLNELETSLVEEGKRYAVAMEQYNTLVLDATSKHVDVVRSFYNNESKMLQLRANLTGDNLSYDALTKPYYLEQAELVKGLGVGQGTNMQALADARAVKLAEMERLQSQTSSLDPKINKPAIDAQSKLKVEVLRLEGAMKHLADTTELVSAAQQKLQEATEARQTKNRFATDYVFSPFEDKMKTIRSIQTIGDMNAGRTDARRLMMAPELLGGVKNIAETYRNVRLPALFGTKQGENGEMIGLTGAEWIDKVSKQYFSQVKMPPGMPGLGELFSAQASAVQVSPEEQVYLDKLQAINAQQVDALSFIADWPDEAASKMKAALVESAAEFAKNFAEKIADYFNNIKTEEFINKSNIRDSKKRDLDIADSIVAKIESSIPGVFNASDSLTQKREKALKIANTLESNEQNIKTYHSLNKTVGLFNEYSANRVYSAFDETAERKGGVALTTEEKQAELRKIFNNNIMPSLSGIFNHEQITKLRSKFINAANEDSDKYNTNIKEIIDEINVRKFGIRDKIMADAGIDKIGVGESLMNISLQEGVMKEFIDSLSRLSSRSVDISRTADSLIELDNSLSILRDELFSAGLDPDRIRDDRTGPVSAGGMAAGGSIFKPRGTDTVPAMLTPGEFVVRREQAQKHRALLESINDGTVYAAAGGYIPYRERQEKIKEDRAAARARHENKMSALRAGQDAKASAYRNRWERDRGISGDPSMLTGTAKDLYDRGSKYGPAIEGGIDLNDPANEAMKMHYEYEPEVANNPYGSLTNRQRRLLRNYDAIVEREERLQKANMESGRAQAFLDGIMAATRQKFHLKKVLKENGIDLDAIYGPTGAPAPQVPVVGGAMPPAIVPPAAPVANAPKKPNSRVTPQETMADIVNRIGEATARGDYALAEKLQERIRKYNEFKNRMDENKKTKEEEFKQRAEETKSRIDEIKEEYNPNNLNKGIKIDNKWYNSYSEYKEQQGAALAPINNISAPPVTVNTNNSPDKFWWETPTQARRRQRDAGQSPWMQRIDARVPTVTQFSEQAKEQLLRQAWANNEVPPEVRGTPFEAEVLNMLAKRVTPEQTKENLDAYNAAVGVRRGLDIVNAPAADVIAANASVGLWESRTQEDFSTASRQRNYNLPPIDRTREPAVLPNGFRRRPVGRGSAYNTRMEPVAGDRQPNYFGIASNSLQELRDLYSNDRKEKLEGLKRANKLRRLFEPSGSLYETGPAPAPKPLSFIEEQAAKINQLTTQHGLPSMKDLGVSLYQDETMSVNGKYFDKEKKIGLRQRAIRPTTGIHEYGHALDYSLAKKAENGTLIPLSLQEGPVNQLLIQNRERILKGVAQYAKKNGYNETLTQNALKASDNPIELFSLVTEGSLPGVEDLQEQLFDTMYPGRKKKKQQGQARGFAAGGYVDNIPAYLSQGEFVMSASATGRIGVNNLKRMNAGGHVNYMADGGTAPAASGVASELALSSAAMTAMETLSNSMVNASTIIQSSVDPLRASFAQFDGSAKLVFDAASAFNTAIQSFSTSIAGLPKEIGVKINNVEALTAQTTNINAALTQFTQGMSSTLGQLNSIMDNINKASTILNGLVGSLKDKLQITVTVTHSPIVVKVEGTKMTATGDTKISDIAINSVKEIDNFKKRLDTFGDIA